MTIPAPAFAWVALPLYAGIVVADARVRRIPLWLSAPLGVAAVVANWNAPFAMLAGALVLGVPSFLVAARLRTRGDKDVIGLGDVLLLAITGAGLGVAWGIAALIAGTLGIYFARVKPPYPLGSFLGMAAIIQLCIILSLHTVKQ